VGSASQAASASLSPGKNFQTVHPSFQTGLLRNEQGRYLKWVEYFY